MKENKVTKWLSNKQIYLLAFSAPVLLMFIIFVLCEVFPFGNRSFMHLDMYHQYYPFLVEFFHKLKSGDSLLFSWNLGAGSNFTALYVYYLASPLNWLCVFVPEQYLLEFMTYLVVFRIGLCGVTFAYYLRSHFQTKHFAIVFFSIFYSLSGYMAAYNWNVMWLDCLVLAPLIILGLERLVKEGKTRLYCITLAIAILSNYYICIMICIYLVLYFIVLLPDAPKKGRALVQFGMYSLIAGGIGAVLLLPELSALKLTEFTSSPFPKNVTSYFPILDILSRHFADVQVETMLDHWPNIYCGVAVMFFLPLYIMDRNIGFREKLAKLVLLAFLIISFSSNTLNFLWHGFNYPDSLPCRQSFLYIILLLTVCFETFLHIREYTKKDLTGVFLGVLFFVLISQKLVTDDAFTTASFYITIVALIFYGVIMNLYMNHVAYAKRLAILTLILVMVEAGVNTGLTSVPSTSREAYFKNHESYTQITDDILKNDTDFYRIEKFKRLTQNDAMLQSFPSATCFSSTNSALITKFFDTFGMQNSRVYYSFQGATPLTSSLLSVKYMLSDKPIIDDPLYKQIEKNGDVTLYENKYTLPLGYIVDSAYLNHNSDEEELLVDEDEVSDIIEGEESDLSMMNPISAQNALASEFSDKGKLFEQINVKDSDKKSAYISVEKDGHIYAYIQNRKVKEATAHSESKQMEFKKLKNPYILDLGYQKAGNVVDITAKEDEGLKLIAYSFNEDVMTDVIHTLSSQSMVVDSFDSTKVNGHITVEKAGQLVLSIPYDPGWKVMVDGKEASISLFEGCMISVPMELGEHTIAMTYFPESLKTGAIISILSLLLLLCLIFREAFVHFGKKSNPTVPLESEEN